MGRAYDGHPYDTGAFEDDYRGFDMREDDDGGRGPLILALAMGVLLIFGAVIWNTYKQGVKPKAAALPVVFADAEPYKRVPDEPGGAESGDLDRRIYDQIDGSAREARAQGERVLVGGPPAELRPGRADSANEADNDRPPVIQLEPLVRSQRVEAAEIAPAPTPTPAPSPVDEPALVAVAETATPPSVPFTRDGGFLVQVAALRSEAAADTAWGQLVATEEDLFDGAEKLIQRADLGANGVFYRLRVGAFADRAAASSFCDALKARERACIVVAG